MRDLLHPVLLGLLVTAIGVIAHWGGRAAAKHAGQLHVDDEETAGNVTQEEGIDGKLGHTRHAVGQVVADEVTPRENRIARSRSAMDADGKPADE